MAMTVIRASCPTCGDCELSASGVLLTTSNAGWAHYAFMCPQCKQEIVKPANAQIIALLKSGQVRFKHVHVPAEYLEDDHSGPPLSYDDLLDFCLELGEDWVPPGVNTNSDMPSVHRWPGPA